MKIVVEIDDEDAELIIKELNINIRKGMESFVKAAVDGLVQVAMLKKSGVEMDIEKIMKSGFNMGREVTKEARKDEDAKG